MKVPAGSEVYKHGTVQQCSGIGLAWSDEDLNEAMGGKVITILFDDKGKANITAILTPLADTSHTREALDRILADREDFENWKVGEAIAEAYLTDHRSCYFPWPDGHDERKSGSSLPGADLVGLSSDDNGDCLAFGEVKTSSDKNYPPSSMYGETGLKKQLEDLRDDELIRDKLLIYLALRARAASWRSRFKTASERYLKDSSDVQLYGVLIRDVQPNDQDLRYRIDSLSIDRPSKTRIELIALYLPEDCINSLGEMASQLKGLH